MLNSENYVENSSVALRCPETFLFYQLGLHLGSVSNKSMF